MQLPSCPGLRGTLPLQPATCAGGGAQEVEVSADCLDILTRLLVADPGARMSMAEIKVHRWFQRGLPPGALEMNDFLLQALTDMEEVRPHSC